jgi:hypothetical protein
MLHDIGVFILVVLFILLCIGSAVNGWDEGVEEAKLKEQEKETQELMNKALKHYTETKGIR